MGLLREFSIPIECIIEIKMVKISIGQYVFPKFKACLLCDFPPTFGFISKKIRVIKGRGNQEGKVINCLSFIKKGNEYD